MPKKVTPEEVREWIKENIEFVVLDIRNNFKEIHEQAIRLHANQKTEEKENEKESQSTL